MSTETKNTHRRGAAGPNEEQISAGRTLTAIKRLGDGRLATEDNIDHVTYEESLHEMGTGSIERNYHRVIL